MTGHIDRNQPNPGSQLTLQHFRVIMRKFLVSLSEAQYVLKESYASLFEENLTIQPLDCREAIDSLKEMQELVQECSNLLTDSSLLPIGALAPRYRLLFASQIVQEQTLHLINLFDNYRVLCLKPSPQAEQTHKKIKEVFRAVLQYISDIPRQALYLEEESKLLEQELTGILREKYA